MNAWQWWSWSVLIILQLTHADETAANSNAAKEAGPNPNESIATHRERQQRDVEWADDAVATDRLSALPKRGPILSRWGGQRLSDLLYFKRRPAFSSWGGKRGPAFSSWGGKRSMPDGKPSDGTPNEAVNSTAANHGNEHLTSTEKEPDANSNHNIYEQLQNEIFMDTPDKATKLLHTPVTNVYGMDSLPIRNFSDNGYHVPTNKIISPSWDEYNVDNNELDDPEDYESYSFEDDHDIPEETTTENENADYEETAEKRAAPSFNSWGGKRAAILGWGSKWIPEFKHWQGKKATAFNSWGGKRAPVFNSWGGKRATAFNSWGGKRSPAFNSWGGKRATAFNSWGGKRATAFNSWGGKRSPAFNSWGGKRTPAFNSWGGKRATAFNSWGGKRTPAFNSWGGKRATAFNSWGGKRATAFNSWGGKRSPAFNSWGGKRDTPFSEGGREDENSEWNDTVQLSENSHRKKRSVAQINSDETPTMSFKPWETGNDYIHYDDKKSTAFNSWGGKRATAFNSWGGKRATPFNSWGGKRATPFNSWGGKRATAFNSWGGKRAPAFNSWGGKRATAFNSWGGKRATAFNSWGGKRATAFNSWGGKRTNDVEDSIIPELNRWDADDSKEQVFYGWGNKPNYDEGLNEKRATPFNKGGGKRLPAFHSWGGKRFKSPTTLAPNENTIHFLGSGSDQNHPFERLGYGDGDGDEAAARRDSDDAAETVDGDYDLKYEDAASPNNYSDETPGRAVKRSFHFGEQDAGGKRDPAFFSWGGKRSDLDENADYDDDGTDAEDIKSVTLDGVEGDDDEDGSSRVNKRNLDSRYNPEYLFQYFKSSYADKRRPIFTSWGGKRTELPAGGGKVHGVRKKRYAGDETENSIALIVSDNDVTGNGIRSTAMNEIYSAVPSALTICCIKRAQYGDRNLFMQMLLRTKSFRDLSWPTIRPIRRGADFYPWGDFDWFCDS